MLRVKVTPFVLYKPMLWWRQGRVGLSLKQRSASFGIKWDESYSKTISYYRFNVVVSHFAKLWITMYYFDQVPSLFLRSYTLKAARPFGGFLYMPYERSFKLSKDFRLRIDFN
jgi:hypothetical protein